MGVELGDLVVERLPAAGEAAQRELGGVVGCAGWRRWKRAARATSCSVFTLPRRSRSSAGAVSITAWSWLAAWVRALTALRRATRSNRIASTVPVCDFGVPGRLAGQHRPGRADGVGRVGLAVAAAMLTVRAGHLDHRHPVGGEEPGQAGAPRPGALDTDRDDVTERPQPPQQPPIASRGRRELFGAEHPADLVERGRDVGVLVRVDAAGDTASVSVIVVIAIPSWSCGWHAQPVTDRPVTGLLHELLSGHVRPTGCAGGVPLTGPTDRLEDIDESGVRRVRPDERNATTILTGGRGH